MFDIKLFIIENLINGVKNGAFAREYANILAINYMSKGIINTEDVEVISLGIEDVLAEKIVEEPIIEETPSEEPPLEEPIV